MPAREPVNRKLLRVATVLTVAGVLLIAVGALIDGEWPNGVAVLGPSLTLAAIVLMRHSQKNQHGGADS